MPCYNSAVDAKFEREVEALAAVGNRKNRRWTWACYAGVLTLPLWYGLGGYLVVVDGSTLTASLCFAVADRTSVHQRDLREVSEQMGLEEDHLRNEVDTYVYGKELE